MSTTSSPLQATTSAPSYTPYYATDYGDPTVNSTVSSCASSTTPTFSPSGAAQCMNALGMGTSCITESASVSAAATSWVGSVAAGASESASYGCENMGLVYNKYQTDVDVSNCIVNSTTTTSETTSSDANILTFNYCTECGGTTTQGQQCPSSTACESQGSSGCAITQSNTSSITSQNDFTVSYSDALTDMITQSIDQAASLAQSESTASGTTENGGKTADISSITSSSDQTNTQINDAITNIIQSYSDSNEVTFNCGAVTPAGLFTSCLGCVDISQMNNSKLMSTSIVQAGFATAISNTSISEALQAGSTTQDSTSTGNQAVPDMFTSSTAKTLYIVLGVVGIVLIIAVVGYLYKRSQQKPSTSTSTSSTSTSTSPTSGKSTSTSPSSTSQSSPSQSNPLTTEL